MNKLLQEFEELYSGEDWFGQVHPFVSLYSNYWKDFVNYSNTVEISNPLLISFPRRFKGQNTKLLIIGQETNGWYDNASVYDGIDSITGLIDIYLDEFCLGTGDSSQFWNAVRKLENLLEIENYQIMWTNLNKVDVAKTSPPDTVRDEILKIFPVVPEEVRIINPDVVVSFTGPDYDSLLEKIFPGILFEEISGFNIRHLAKIRHKSLPDNSFRSYHPHYLYRSKTADKTLEAISKNVK